MERLPAFDDEETIPETINEGADHNVAADTEASAQMDPRDRR